MKNSLIALIWAITLLQVSAQKSLPKSVKPYLPGLDQKVLKALDQVGFECSSNYSKVTESLVQQRSGALQLDSTISFYGYDFVGTDDSIAFQRTIFEYPSSSLEIQTDAQFDNDNWLTLSRSNITRDNQKRITEVLSEAFDEEKGGFVPDSKAIAYPHEDDQTLVDSFYVYGWDTLAMDWLLLFYNLNKYDAQDRLVETIASFDYLGQPLLIKDVHTYDVNGDNTLIETFALFGGAEIPTEKQELSYQNHQLEQVVTFAQDGAGGFFPELKITYAYTSFGQQAQVNSYAWSLDANDWVQTEGDTYEYDNAERLKSRENVIYNPDGAEEHTLAKYDYVEDNKLHSEAYYYLSGTTYFLDNRKFYYYSDGTLANDAPNALPLVITPNPTTGIARLNLESPALIRIYNAQGDLLSSGTYQPNYSLNISDLPPGLYVITAQAENEQFVGRLIKA